MMHLYTGAISLAPQLKQQVNPLYLSMYYQARAEGGGAVGAWAPTPFPLDAQSALLSRQFLFFFFFFNYNFFVIKRPFVKACPI